MARLFDDHIKRYSRSLNGAWSFKVDAQGVGKDEKWFLGLKNPETVNIPSVWNTELGLLGYEGACWYEKNFYFDGNLRLHFGAVMTECEVWLDGNYIGNHYGGFCEFSFTIPDVKAGEHRLTLLVNNSFDKHSIPQVKVDWYHYGGIIRDVEAARLVGISIINHKFEYTLSDDMSSATAHAIVELYNAESEIVTSEITYSVGDKIILSKNVTLDAGAVLTLVSDDVVLENIELWDIGSPKLYTSKIETDTDDIYDRVGFRKVEVSPDGVILNGS